MRRCWEHIKRKTKAQDLQFRKSVRGTVGGPPPTPPKYTQDQETVRSLMAKDLAKRDLNTEYGIVAVHEFASHPANTNTPVASSYSAPASSSISSFAPAAFSSSSILLPPTPSTSHSSPPVSSLSPAVPPVSSVTFTSPSPPPVFNDPSISVSPNSSVFATLSSHSSTISSSNNSPQSVLKRKKASRSPSSEVGGCLDAISKRDEELHLLRKRLVNTKLIVEENNLELSRLQIELAKRKLESYEAQQANEEAHHGEVLSLVVSMRQLITSVFGACQRSDNY